MYRTSQDPSDLGALFPLDHSSASSRIKPLQLLHLIKHRELYFTCRTVCSLGLNEICS